MNDTSRGLAYVAPVEFEPVEEVGRPWYLAGPMTGYPDHNFPTFRDAADHLRAEGWRIVSPAELDVEDDSVLDRPATDDEWREFLRRDLKIVAESAGVIVLPGWQHSRGARLEVQTALGLGLPVYCYDSAFCDGVDPDDVVTEVPALEESPIVRMAKTPGSGVSIEWADDEGRPVFAKPFEQRDADGEVRVVDPTTGGEKGQKTARFDLIPAGPLKAVATHYGKGAEKYEDRNWEKGYRWSLSFGAMQRHAWAFWGGEDLDAETGTPHLAAVVFHAFALLEFCRTHPDLDDRPTT